jgi:hypothetical protein
LHVVFGGGFGDGEGFGDRNPVGFSRKVIFKRAPVDHDFAASDGHTDAGDGGFPPAGAKELSSFSHNKSN